MTRCEGLECNTDNHAPVIIYRANKLKSGGWCCQFTVVKVIYLTVYSPINQYFKTDHNIDKEVV